MDVLDSSSLKQKWSVRQCYGQAPDQDGDRSGSFYAGKLLNLPFLESEVPFRSYKMACSQRTPQV